MGVRRLTDLKLTLIILRWITISLSFHDRRALRGHREHGRAPLQSVLRVEARIDISSWFAQPTRRVEQRGEAEKRQGNRHRHVALQTSLPTLNLIDAILITNPVANHISTYSRSNYSLALRLLTDAYFCRLDDPVAWAVLPTSCYLRSDTTRWSLGASDIMFTNP